ncbi:aquaporin [Arthrobacter sp. ATA002]|uniref:aquaporin n=1 Tax=Arthrobacter sp. ATA002 TaxID=2991715 RepID=UPI0022A7CF5C|nr:aquaporin [Arthrobacter sp. ATA002]WAP52833.1 aquaporin [Arthrobacter sp. ATA002]
MNAEPLSAGGARAAHPAAATAPRKRLHTYGLPARSAAEAVGAFFLVFVGVGLAFFSATGSVSSPMGVGLAAAAAMVAFGYVSGGHFNPAISIASAAAGRTAWKALPVYVLAQLLGAVLAVALLWVVIQGVPQLADTRMVFSALANGYGEQSGAQFPLASGLLTEVIGAALLTAVFLGATSGRRPVVGAAFAVGVTYAILLTFLAPITGGSLNPARSSAVAFFAEDAALQQLWLFWAAPVLGALIAGLIYRSIDLTAADAARNDDDFEDVDGDGASESGTDTDIESAAGAGPADASGARTGTVAPGASARASANRTPDARNDDDARGFFNGDDDGDGDNNGGTPAGKA